MPVLPRVGNTGTGEALMAALKIRFDVANILDQVYELRAGSGIGVGAPQFGQRRGFYGTVA